MTLEQKRQAIIDVLGDRDMLGSELLLQLAQRNQAEAADQLVPMVRAGLLAAWYEQGSPMYAVPAERHIV